jgi:citrate synthase
MEGRADKPGGGSRPMVSPISRVEPHRIEIRGRDLCRDLMGRLTFTEFFYFLLTGRIATEEQRFFLDLLLIAIAEHGLTPTAQAARMTLSAAPDSMQAAVAAGILGCGPAILGTAEACGALLIAARRRSDSGEDPDTAVRTVAREIHRSGGRAPGFGHPVHRPTDPRAERILELALARGAAARHVDLAMRFRTAVSEIWQKALPMNVSMPIAAVLLDQDFPPEMIKAVPILARTAGLLAHLADERERPIGLLLAREIEGLGAEDEAARADAAR